MLDFGFRVLQPNMDSGDPILQFLHAHRIPAWRVNTGATKIGGRFIRFGAVGMSDILAILSGDERVHMGDPGGDHRGQACFIEVKSVTGRVSLAQQAFLDQVTAAGGRAFVARDVATVALELGL